MCFEWHHLVIARIWEPVLVAPLFSAMFLYFSSAIVGYARGGPSLPFWLRRFVGWAGDDDRVARSLGPRIYGVAFFAVFVVIEEWVAFGPDLEIK